jgi:signal transduction histidine kinase
VQDASVWNATVHPDDWPRVQRILNDHLQGRIPEYAAEHRVRTAAGGWIWILVRGRVSARDDEGRPIRMVGTALDTTSRKRFEEEQAFLAEAGAILASSLEYEDTLNRIAGFAARKFADLCLVNLIEEGGVQRLKTFTRDPSKAWIGDLLMRVPIDPARSRLLSTILETKRPLLMEAVPQEQIDIWSQTEEYRQVLEVIPVGSIIGAPLLAHGKAVGSLWLIRSTASTPYAPSDLRLAQALAERAALAIENARNYRAAQRAVEARDSLMGIVAHDLRNPLGSILMQTAMLKRSGDQAERRSRKPVESIERGAKRMNRLIQDLLDVTKLEAGRLSIQQARVDPGRQVSDAVEAQRTLADAASLTIESYVEPDLPEVWADRERLLQVFENLIGNAIKFTNPGGRIDVGATRGNAEVLFRVSDTGAGIDATNLPHVFDRFWQAPGARRHGAGLGLPIVKGIVEAHHGRIWAESEAGHGSTFFFTIPAAPPSPDAPPREDLVPHAVA